MNKFGWAAALTKRTMYLVALAAIAGCVIVPTPGTVYEGSRRAVIAEDVIVSLKPSDTTREDVLLRLGDPTERVEGDRFFIYQWTTGDILVVIFLPGAVVGGSIPTNHLLSLEFSPSNRLIRVGQFEEALPGGDGWEPFLEWLAGRGSVRIIPLGSTRDDVDAQLGKPVLVIPLPDGGLVAIYEYSLPDPGIEEAAHLAFESFETIFVPYALYKAATATLGEVTFTYGPDGRLLHLGLPPCPPCGDLDAVGPVRRAQAGLPPCPPCDDPEN